MDKIKEYLSNPATWISFCIFLFWIGATWGTLSSRINELEKNLNDIDMASIQSQLSSIQTDLQRIKYQLQK